MRETAGSPRERPYKPSSMMSQPPCRTDRGPHHDFFSWCSVGPALTILAVVFRDSAQATTITTDQLEAAFCPSHPDAKTLARLQKADSEFQCGNASTHNTAKQQAATHNVSSATQVAKGDTEQAADTSLC